jgi:hypothetical protein
MEFRSNSSTMRAAQAALASVSAPVRATSNATPKARLLATTAQTPPADLRR